jgi:hypothetical protein
MFSSIEAFLRNQPHKGLHTEALVTITYNQPKVNRLYESIAQLHSEIDWLCTKPSYSNGLSLQKFGCTVNEFECARQYEFGSSFERRPLVQFQKPELTSMDIYPQIPYHETHHVLQYSKETLHDMYLAYRSQVYTTRHPHDWKEALWVRLLDANFHAYNNAEYALADILVKGSVRGMVCEWFDYDVYREYMDSPNTVSNLKLVEKFLSGENPSLSWVGSLFPTAIYSGHSIVGPNRLDFLTDKEIELYRLLNRTGYRQLTLQNTLMLTTFPYEAMLNVICIGERDDKFFASHLKCVDESIADNSSDILVRYDKSLGVIDGDWYLDVARLQSAVLVHGVYKTTLGKKPFNCFDYTFTLKGDVLYLEVQLPNGFDDISLFHHVYRANVLLHRITQYLGLVFGESTVIARDVTVDYSVEWNLLHESAELLLKPLESSVTSFYETSTVCYPPSDNLTNVECE